MSDLEHRISELEIECKSLRLELAAAMRALTMADASITGLVIALQREDYDRASEIINEISKYHKKSSVNLRGRLSDG